MSNDILKKKKNNEIEIYHNTQKKKRTLLQYYDNYLKVNSMNVERMLIRFHTAYFF